MTEAPPVASQGAVWAALPLPALLIDGGGRIGAANPAAESFLNASARMLCGQPALDRLAIDAPMDEAFARVRANRAAISLGDVDVTGGERAPVRCDIHLAPLDDTPGGLLMILAPREIAGRLGSGIGARSAVQSAIGMAAMLAHEIKNPLAGITGAAQLLEMGLPPSERELTGLIVEEGRRIVRLLDEVGQFGDLRPPLRRPVNIHDVLDRARHSALMGIAARMRILCDYDPSLPPTAGDPDQLIQVFLNLIRNAAEAAGAEGGTIRLRTFYDRSLRIRGSDGRPAALPLNVEITDDGPGIAPRIAAHVFEPFVSGCGTGRGLGLALVSQIVAGHGGWISAESVPGRTVFRLSLPTAPAERRGEA